MDSKNDMDDFTWLGCFVHTNNARRGSSDKRMSRYRMSVNSVQSLRRTSLNYSMLPKAIGIYASLIAYLRSVSSHEVQTNECAHHWPSIMMASLLWRSESESRTSLLQYSPHIYIMDAGHTQCAIRPSTMASTLHTGATQAAWSIVAMLNKCSQHRHYV